MKRALLAVVVMLALCGAVKADPNDSLTLWVSGANLSYQNTELSTWLGFRHENVETGVAAAWRIFSESDIEPDDQSNFAIGAYGAYHFPGVIDVNNPLNVDWLPEKIAAEPFLAIAYLIDVDGKGTTIEPAAGMRILDLFTIKYTYNFYNGVPAQDEGRLGLSARWRFK